MSEDIVIHNKGNDDMFSSRLRYKSKKNTMMCKHGEVEYERVS